MLNSRSLLNIVEENAANEDIATNEEAELQNESINITTSSIISEDDKSLSSKINSSIEISNNGINLKENPKKTINLPTQTRTNSTSIKKEMLNKFQSKISNNEKSNLNSYGTRKGSLYFNTVNELKLEPKTVRSRSANIDNFVKNIEEQSSKNSKSIFPKPKPSKLELPNKSKITEIQLKIISKDEKSLNNIGSRKESLENKTSNNQIIEVKRLNSLQKLNESKGVSIKKQMFDQYKSKIVHQEKNLPQNSKLSGETIEGNINVVKPLHDPVKPSQLTSQKSEHKIDNNKDAFFNKEDKSLNNPGFKRDITDSTENKINSNHVVETKRLNSYQKLTEPSGNSVKQQMLNKFQPKALSNNEETSGKGLRIGSVQTINRIELPTNKRLQEKRKSSLGDVNNIGLKLNFKREESITSKTQNNDLNNTMLRKESIKSKASHTLLPSQQNSKTRKSISSEKKIDANIAKKDSLKKNQSNQVSDDSNELKNSRLSKEKIAAIEKISFKLAKPSKIDKETISTKEDIDETTISEKKPSNISDQNVDLAIKNEISIDNNIKSDDVIKSPDVKVIDQVESNIKETDHSDLKKETNGKTPEIESSLEKKPILSKHAHPHKTINGVNFQNELFSKLRPKMMINVKDGIPKDLGKPVDNNGKGFDSKINSAETEAKINDDSHGHLHGNMQSLKMYHSKIKVKPNKSKRNNNSTNIDLNI